MVKRIEEKYKTNGDWIITKRIKSHYYDKNGKKITTPGSFILSHEEIKEVKEKYTISEGDTSDYWEATAANAITALKNLMHIAVELPDGIWKGD